MGEGSGAAMSRVACVESTIDLTDPQTGYTVRLWCDVSHGLSATLEQQRALLALAREALDVIGDNKRDQEITAAADVLDREPNISAYQFIRPPIADGPLQGARMGLVVYTKWP